MVLFDKEKPCALMEFWIIIMSLGSSANKIYGIILITTKLY